MATKQILDDTTVSLKRMQDFDVQTLVRAEELGRGLNFEEALEPAKRLVQLYQRLSLSVLEDFTDGILSSIRSQADADFSRFKQILDFSPSQGNPAQVRTELINQIKAAYDATFNSLWQHIAYGVSKIVDTQRLENEARGVLQSITDKADGVAAQLEESRDAAKGILDEIREVAAEQGVSQQAAYFKNEAELHKTEAESWRMTTIKAAWLVGGFAGLTLVLSYIPLLQPESTFQAIQVVTGKVLLFGVLAYLLGLAAKNFIAHKHNEVINRHRQNALMTFKALAEAAHLVDSKDIVLTHASGCIFSPQDAGYTKANPHESSSSLTKSVVEVLPRATLKQDQ